MQIPVEIDFQGMAASPETQTAVADLVAKLEQRFGRITACRLVVKAPSGHHQTGGLYDINIRLSLPDGREVNVGRTSQDDERYADLNYALNDAFKRARRRLQDKVRRLQGKVKHHESPPMGVVVRIDKSGEFGFLEADDGREIYFHRNSVLDGAFSRLEEGSRVTFAEEAGEKGAQASTVRLMGKHSLRA